MPTNNVYNSNLRHSHQLPKAYRSRIFVNFCSAYIIVDYIYLSIHLQTRKAILIKAQENESVINNPETEDLSPGLRPRIA